MLWMSRLERINQQKLPFNKFLKRLGRNFLVTVGIVAFSMTVGTLGYHYLGGLPWIDGFLNAAMILTGMGPVDRMESVEGKLFAAFYALYSGLALLSMVAVLITPIYHRFIHQFHLSSDKDEEDEDKPGPPPPEPLPPNLVA